MNRPAVWAAAGFTAGVYAGAASGMPIWAAIAASLAAAAILPLLLRRRLPRDAVALACCFAAGGIVPGALYGSPPPGDALYRLALEGAGRRLAIEAIVREAPLWLEGTGYAKLVADIETVREGGATLPVQGRALLRWRDPAARVYPGQRIAFEGTPDPTLGRVNLGLGGVEDAYRARGIHTRFDLHARAVRMLGTARPAAYALARLRQDAADRLARAMPDPIRPFVFAIWLGDRAHFDDAGFQRFVESGTAHVLAVSGAHVGILFALIDGLARSLLRRPRLRAAIGLAAVWAFALLSGAGVSVLRAAFMITLYASAAFVRREPDAPTALAMAAFAFLLRSAALLFDAAFLLSFASVASILLFYDPIAAHLARLPHALRSLAASTIAAQILTLPLAIHYFALVSIAALPANLVVIPLAGIVLALCLAATLAVAILPPVAPLFGHAIAPAAALTQWCVGRFAEIPGARWYLPSPTPAAAAAYWAAALVLLHLLRRGPNPRGYAALAACALAAGLLWRAPYSPGIDILDVGHGDAALVRTPGGTTLLIDAGNRTEDYDYGARIVAPFLLAHGITRLDYAIGTHPDADHIGGLAGVLERVPARTLILGPNPSNAPLERDLIAFAGRRGIPLQRMAAGQRIPAAGAGIQILHPPAQGWEDAADNDQSLVLRVEWPGLSTLLTGDIEHAAEAAVAARHCTAGFLKAPHHGSRTSSSQTLLDAARANTVLVSTAPTRGRPAIPREILERYRRNALDVYRTDQHGGLRLTVTPAGPRIEAARAARGWTALPKPPKPKTP